MSKVKYFCLFLYVMYVHISINRKFISSPSYLKSSVWKHYFFDALSRPFKLHESCKLGEVLNSISPHLFMRRFCGATFFQWISLRHKSPSCTPKFFYGLKLTLIVIFFVIRKFCHRDIFFKCPFIFYFTFISLCLRIALLFCEFFTSIFLPKSRDRLLALNRAHFRVAFVKSWSVNNTLIVFSVQFIWN